MSTNILKNAITSSEKIFTIPAKKDLQVFEDNFCDLSLKVSLSETEQKIQPLVRQLGKYFSLSDEPTWIKQFKPQILNELDPQLLQRVKFYTVEHIGVSEFDVAGKVVFTIALDREFGRIIFLDVCEKVPGEKGVDEEQVILAMSEYEKNLQWYTEETKSLIDSLVSPKNQNSLSTNTSEHDDLIMSLLEKTSTLHSDAIKGILNVLSKPDDFSTLFSKKENLSSLANSSPKVVEESTVDLAAKLANVNNVKERLLSENKEIRKDNKVLEAQVSVKSEENTHLKVKVKNLESATKDLQSSHDKLLRKKASLEKEVIDLKQQHEKACEIITNSIEGQVYIHTQEHVPGELKHSIIQQLIETLGGIDMKLELLKTLMDDPKALHQLFEMYKNESEDEDEEE